MHIAICGDVHWSEHSSIVRSRGKKYSTRLENLIDSIKWFLQLSVNRKCDMIIFMGDFFDRPDCSVEEISALQEIDWNINIPIYFLCGNHEMGVYNHSFSSAKVFELLSGGIVVPDPGKITFNDTEICFLPYLLESERESLISYFGPRTSSKRVIVSHNDISGIQMGAFKSQLGFTIDEIENNCDLFLNGHLHNGCWVTDKIINVGNITGQNFSEDGFKYRHRAYILDTDTMNIQSIENPNALYFYKLDATVSSVDIDALSNNSVITLRCYHDEVPRYKDLIESSSKIVESRIIAEVREVENPAENVSIEDLSVDHMLEFKNFIHSSVGSSDIIDFELEEICK